MRAGHIVQERNGKVATVNPKKREFVMRDFRHRNLQLLCGIPAIRLGHNLDTASVVVVDGLVATRCSGWSVIIKGMSQSAEFEAAIMARRVDIQALRAEARRLESEGEDVWELGITIPAGWLPALAQGLDHVMHKWENEEADECANGLVSEEASSEDAELLERMRSLASAIRDVEPGNAYIVSACDREALWKGIAGALFIQEIEVQMMSKYVDPPVLRFVAIEQRDALARLFSDLCDLLVQAEGD